MQSLLHFLRVHPFTSQKVFNDLIVTQMKNGGGGLHRLQQILASVCLRRSKNQEVNGKRLLDLPEKVLSTVKCTFGETEKALYETLAMSGKKQFKSLLKNDGSMLKQYAFVLEMLLRMRQACDHISLVPPKYAKGFMNLSDEDELKRKSAMVALLDESVENCAICLTDAPTDPCISPCSHVFCQLCIDNRFRQSSSVTCPVCLVRVLSVLSLSVECVAQAHHAHNRTPLRIIHDRNQSSCKTLWASRCEKFWTRRTSARRRRRASCRYPATSSRAR